ncbi:kanamycin kinase/aminoglycoside 3'-phosphotransferase-2 [Thermosporothrix hazakensis]|jgi:aminoglycoside phosphotransferase|uniref:Kanamycin kinase/aminoglycoside 3'-phosphotransferase-2 n=2 Tax=Thermosporothrix TaxID=768650 RepID=A0A326U2D3_THEHA|nr:APH(3') family aminoglycoside O-phosphotransferase [Thermosporothrix hazakensis]PZW25448.1 kanamycin kinase/aminoglycoside 3'-phosphotransferase-2 [Thermosporothrix hazakensis]BBH90784.1 aminoglycoside phosphotransferase APH(3') [Thermosporothrix sp. COM3]GCE48834.1 aminoglycoside phosphotransferase APH(3') [Thermosporothrix hazakensis]
MEQQQGFSALPQTLQELLEPYKTAGMIADEIGCSLSRVFQIGPYYLKMTPESAAIKLLAEKERLEWLQGRLPVPQVHFYGQDERFEYLLLSTVPGKLSCDRLFLSDLPALVRLLAEGLRQIHAIPIADCPFDMRLEQRLSRARSYVYSNRIADAPSWAFRSAEEARALYERLAQTQPPEDPVLTHGDYCLPNILIQSWRISGFIDLAQAGVADRYFDLALACRSLLYNFPEAEPLLPEFFQTYGISSVDREKLDYYRLLDELTEL